MLGLARCARPTASFFHGVARCRRCSASPSPSTTCLAPIYISGGGFDRGSHPARSPITSAGRLDTGILCDSPYSLSMCTVDRSMVSTCCATVCQPVCPRCLMHASVSHGYQWLAATDRCTGCRHVVQRFVNPFAQWCLMYAPVCSMG
jgi:hypothetical protein